MTGKNGAAVSTPIVSIPIADAFICCGCEIVIDTPQVCPKCASGEAIASLSAWLSRRAMDDVRLMIAVKALTQISAVGAKA